jgi:hypothetical protein
MVPYERTFSNSTKAEKFAEFVLIVVALSDRADFTILPVLDIGFNVGDIVNFDVDYLIIFSNQSEQHMCANLPKLEHRKPAWC